MLSIIIKTIPHKEQRCDGNVGDYWLENDGKELQVRVSELSDWRYEFLIAVHELIEFFLCRWAGIEEPVIQAFDEEYYRQQALGVKPKDQEAGDDVEAPYHWQHVFATCVEHMIAHLLKVDWANYCAALEEIN